MSIAITKPEPLPTDRYVSIAERKAWTTAMSAYEAGLREDSKPPVTTEPEASVRYLTDEEYNAERKAEWQRNRTLEKEREDAREAEHQAKQKFLESEPETVTVTALDPYSFLIEFQHRVTQGYRLDDTGMGPILPNYYLVTMTKPAAPARKTK